MGATIPCTQPPGTSGSQEGAEVSTRESNRGARGPCSKEVAFAVAYLCLGGPGGLPNIQRDLKDIHTQQAHDDNFFARKTDTSTITMNEMNKSITPVKTFETTPVAPQWRSTCRAGPSHAGAVRPTRDC